MHNFDGRRFRRGIRGKFANPIFDTQHFGYNLPVEFDTVEAVHLNRFSLVVRVILGFFRILGLSGKVVRELVCLGGASRKDNQLNVTELIEILAEVEQEEGEKVRVGVVNVDEEMSDKGVVDAVIEGAHKGGQLKEDDVVVGRGPERVED